MNGIAELQNQPQFLEKLSASNRLYDQSVGVAYIQFIIAVIIAIVFPILSNYFPAYQGWLTIGTLLYFIVQVFYLHEWEGRRRHDATVLQEIFDTELFSLPWNEVIAGERMTDEQLKKYLRKNKNLDKEENLNWYPPAVAEVSLPMARIMCQRSSVWWNSRLRRTCAQIIMGLNIVIIVALLWIYRNAPAGSFSNHLVLFLPLFEILITTAFSYRKSANRMHRLRVILDNFLKKYLEDKQYQVPEDTSRAIQDEIFRNRASARPTPRFIYAMLLARYKKTMNLSAEEYIAKLLRG